MTNTCHFKPNIALVKRQQKIKSLFSFKCYNVTFSHCQLLLNLIVLHFFFDIVIQVTLYFLYHFKFKSSVCENSDCAISLWCHLSQVSTNLNLHFVCKPIFPFSKQREQNLHPYHVLYCFIDLFVMFMLNNLPRLVGVNFILIINVNRKQIDLSYYILIC